MKISELKFNIKKQGPHHSSYQALLKVNEEYELSILKPIDGKEHYYCHANEGQYEVGVLKNGEFEDCYDDDANDGVFDYCTEEKVLELIERFKNK